MINKVFLKSNVPETINACNRKVLILQYRHTKALR